MVSPDDRNPYAQPWDDDPDRCTLVLKKARTEAEQLRCIQSLSSHTHHVFRIPLEEDY